MISIPQSLTRLWSSSMSGPSPAASVSASNPAPDARKPTEIELLTPEDVARMIRQSLITLARWRASGEGPRYVKLGRKIAYRRDALDEWIKGQEVRSIAEHKANRKRSRVPSIVPKS
jgi:predicted DNA-binding transcriptional regulator AlpA